MPICNGIAQEFFDHALDKGWDGGRVQRCLSRVRGGAQDTDHVLGKADVQHLVGLIKHRNPDIVQSEGAAFHVILNAPRRADDDLWVCFAVL